MEISPDPGARDTSRGHLPRGGPVGGGAPLVARVSGLRQPRLREHEAGQARADVIGSAPRAPGQAGEGGHRAGRERGREGVARCRWPNKPEGWERVPAAIHPKTFPQTHCKGRGDPNGSDSKAPSVARALPPPRSLPSPGPRSEHPQACPLGSGLPPPLPGLPVLPGPATRSKLLPPAAAQAQPPQPPPLAPALRCSAQIVRAVTLVGGQGPRGRRDYPGALPPSAHPLPLHVRRQRGTPRARCPRTRVGHEAPHARARTHARPQAGEALTTARRHQAGTTAYLGMVEVQQ